MDIFIPIEDGLRAKRGYKIHKRRQPAAVIDRDRCICLPYPDNDLGPFTS